MPFLQHVITILYFISFAARKFTILIVQSTFTGLLAIRNMFVFWVMQHYLLYLQQIGQSSFSVCVRASVYSDHMAT